MSVRLVASALLVGLAPVTALATCPAAPVPAGFVLKPGAELFGLEGPLTHVNYGTDGSTPHVVVAGTCVEIPTTVLVDNDADGVGDIPLSAIQAGTSGRAPEGGTMIIDGDVTVDAAGNLKFTATLPYFEFGEHVIVGPLVSVAADDSSFTVGHTTVVVNSDARLPGRLWDLNGDQIEISALRGWEGTIVGAEGYMHAGQLNGTLIETEVIPPVEGVDSVAVERAQLRSSKNSVDIRGQVTPQAGTANFTGQVHIDIGCNTARDGAGDPVLTGAGASIENVAVVTVDPVLNLGDWRWTSGNNAVPAGSVTVATTVCVYSDLGGESAPRNFTVRQ
jgi:hypothetical protein